MKYNKKKIVIFFQRIHRPQYSKESEGVREREGEK